MEHTRDKQLKESAINREKIDHVVMYILHLINMAIGISNSRLRVEGQGLVVNA